MSVRNLDAFRRRKVRVADPADNVILAGVVLECTNCGASWTAELSPVRDEIVDERTRCVSCDSEPPRAA
jgi:hypothetical protein